MLKSISTMIAAATITLGATGTALAQDEQPPHTPPRVSQAAGNVGGTMLWAYVAPDGSHVPGSGGLGLVSTTKLSLGTYEVLFRRGIANFCVYIPTIGRKGGGTTNHGFVTAVKRGTNNKGLFIKTYDTAGASADRDFNVMVSCTQ